MWMQNSHDSTSSTSKQVLELLTSYNSQLNHRSAVPSTRSSHRESCVVEANGSGADVNSYLRQAADPPRSPLFQLEIVDRQSNPPTPDQMRSIIDYLVSDPPSSSSLSSSREKLYTSSAFDLAEHERRKLALKQHLANTGEQSGMPKIKDGPLVVNWDDGSATTSLQGVQHMLKRLQDQAHTDDTSPHSPGCLVS